LLGGRRLLLNGRPRGLQPARAYLCGSTRRPGHLHIAAASVPVPGHDPGYDIFQLLTARELRTRQVLTGGTFAAAAWMLLQIFGSGFVAARLHKTNELYGIFAVVLATLAWLYLQSLILMLAAEINVVRHRRLWPRGLLTPFTDDVELTLADCRAYEMYLATQRFKGFETVNVNFSRDRRPSRASRQEDSADRPVGPPRGRQPRVGRRSPR
jgi:Virulence factor BrkB